MMSSLRLGSEVVANELILTDLLAECEIVGGIYTMAFDHCLVLTNDLWKQRAGGVSRHTFLLATAIVPGSVPDIEDEEIILLRVMDPASLPIEADLVQIRAEAMREIITQHGKEQASSSSAILDVLTRNEIQFSGIKTKVLGTFYETTVDGRPVLTFGSDLDSFYSSSRYKVYKPFGTSLSLIASYPTVTPDEERELASNGTMPRRLNIGKIRYSSTERRRRRDASKSIDTAVPVSVRIEDFVALKTAVFGMTRLGKSNTMKTIATAICQYAGETGQTIGQLLFDPAGEYANVNVQDRTALSELGSEFVTIFRYGSVTEEPGIRPLTTNFFADETIDVTWSIIKAYLGPRRDADYIKSFLGVELTGPAEPSDDWSAFHRARRRRSALYATLIKASFPTPDNFTSRISVNAKVLSAINAQVRNASEKFQASDRGELLLSTNQLPTFWQAVIAAADQEAKSNKSAKSATEVTDWLDPELLAILAVFRGSVGSGFRILSPLRVFHSPQSDKDYAAEVLTELAAGKVVIVDLSLGTESVLQFSSERIINHIVQDAARRFATGQDPLNIQIFIEEAHRLFDRDRMKVASEADPYVRLAKEAAKFKIGLIYATQEVSSVDPIILSNTSNWIVTHLNNHNEVRELSKYYDFAEFADLTLSAEDVGFARLKTRSGRYIIPVQIDLFDQTKIDGARAALSRVRVSR